MYPTGKQNLQSGAATENMLAVPRLRSSNDFTFEMSTDRQLSPEVLPVTRYNHLFVMMTNQ